MSEIITQISDAFGTILGPQIAISVTVIGYIIFFLTFYSKAESSRWKDFEWGDRVLLGLVIGLGAWYFIALPIAVYIEALCLLLSISLSNSIFAGLNLPLIILLLVAVFLCFARRNLGQPLYSSSGAMLLGKYFRRFFSSILIPIGFMLFTGWAAFFYWLDYRMYPIYKTLLLSYAITCMATVFLVVGQGIFYSFLLRRADPFDFLIMANKAHINLRRFFEKRLPRKYFFVAKHWFFFLILLGFLTSLVIVEVDKNFAIFVPIYERGTPTVEWTSILLARKPPGDSVFAVEMKETILVKTAFQSLFNYVIIENPSNYSYQEHFGTMPYAAYIDPFEAKLVEGNLRFLNLTFKETLNSSSWYNVTLYYYVEVTRNIQIDEMKSPAVRLENGTCVASYSITISNNEPFNMYTSYDFAAVNLVTDLRIPEGTNYTIQGFKNGLKMEYLFEDIKGDWFYPEMWVEPNKSVNYTFVFSWTI